MEKEAKICHSLAEHCVGWICWRLAGGLRFRVVVLVAVVAAVAMPGSKETRAQGLKPSEGTVERIEHRWQQSPQELSFGGDGGAVMGPQAPLHLLGETIVPGTRKRLFWTAGQTFEGEAVSTPVLAANGRDPGPVLCLTAAIHGDEINGIMIVHQVMEWLDLDRLHGAVIGVPIVNLRGYRRNTRYLPDRRDLNRYFPGSVNGSTASRMAYTFFQDVVTSCEVLVDLHTGSFHRTNLPQVRADLRYPEVVQLAQGFGGITVVHKEGLRGTLRRAAIEAGIPAITFEAGKPKRLQLRAVEVGVQGVKALIKLLAMVNEAGVEPSPGTVFSQATWIRTRRAGILVSEVQPGDSVKRGQQLGVIIDPTTNWETAIISPSEGYILGMALNQVTMPGFAAYHLGIRTEKLDADGDSDSEKDRS